MLPTRASPGPRPSLQSPSLLNRRWVLQTIATCKNHLLRFIYLLAFEKELGGQRRRDVNFKGFSWKKLTNLIRAGSLRPMPAGPTQKRWPQTRLVRGRMPEGTLPAGLLLGRGHGEGGQREGSPKKFVSGTLLNDGGLATSASSKTNPAQMFPGFTLTLTKHLLKSLPQNNLRGTGLRFDFFSFPWSVEEES